MKSTLILSITLIAILPVGRAATIAEWNFNSAVPDGNTSTGTLLPSIGVGTAALVGSISGTFTAGDTKHDPAASTDNSAWHTASYPAATQADTSAGVRFNVDTTGYERSGGISVILPALAVMSACSTPLMGARSPMPI